MEKNPTRKKANDPIQKEKKISSKKEMKVPIEKESKAPILKEKKAPILKEKKASVHSNFQRCAKDFTEKKPSPDRKKSKSLGQASVKKKKVFCSVQKSGVKRKILLEHFSAIKGNPKAPCSRASSNALKKGENQRLKKKPFIEKKFLFFQIENLYPFFFRDGHLEKGKKIILEATKLVLDKNIQKSSESKYTKSKPKYLKK